MPIYPLYSIYTPAYLLEIRFLVAHSFLFQPYCSILSSLVVSCTIKSGLGRRSHSSVHTPDELARDARGAKFCYPPRLDQFWPKVGGCGELFSVNSQGIHWEILLVDRSIDPGLAPLDRLHQTTDGRSDAIGLPGDAL
jgi:hypothetical protein